MSREKQDIELIHSLKEKLNSFGFTVYYEENRAFLHFSDGEDIGYAQADHLLRGSVSFSSEVRPSREFGTGSSIARELSLFEVTKEMCENTLAASSRGKYKYSSPEAWLETAFNKENTEVYVPEKEPYIFDSKVDMKSVSIDESQKKTTSHGSARGTPIRDIASTLKEENSVSLGEVVSNTKP